MGFDSAWEKIHASRSWGKYPNEYVVSFMMSTFGNCLNRQDIKVLDLGFGGGGNLWFLVKEGFDAYGIDGSPSALKKTEIFLSQNQLQAKIRCGDMTDLSLFSDKFFDVVIDVRSMSNVPYNEVGLVFGGINRILKKNGFFMTFLYGKSCNGYLRGRRLESRTFTDIKEGVFAGVGHVTIYSPKDIRSLFKEFGLKIVNWKRILQESMDANDKFEDHVVIAVKK